MSIWMGLKSLNKRLPNSLLTGKSKKDESVFNVWALKWKQWILSWLLIKMWCVTVSWYVWKI